MLSSNQCISFSSPSPHPPAVNACASLLFLGRGKRWSAGCGSVTSQRCILMWNRLLSNRTLGPCTDRLIPPFYLPTNPARSQSFFEVVLQTLPRVAQPLDTAKGRHTK